MASSIQLTTHMARGLGHSVSSRLAILQIPKRMICTTLMQHIRVQGICMNFLLSTFNVSSRNAALYFVVRVYPKE
jgi:hypothetical protein